jgi:hypothetical protein
LRKLELVVFEFCFHCGRDVGIRARRVVQIKGEGGVSGDCRAGSVCEVKGTYSTDDGQGCHVKTASFPASGVAVTIAR